MKKTIAIVIIAARNDGYVNGWGMPINANLFNQKLQFRNGEPLGIVKKVTEHAGGVVEMPIDVFVGVVEDHPSRDVGALIEVFRSIPWQSPEVAQMQLTVVDDYGTSFTTYRPPCMDHVDNDE